MKGFVVNGYLESVITKKCLENMEKKNMKAVLKFDLSKKEDKEIYEKCNKSKEAFSALKQIKEKISNMARYREGLDVNDQISLPEGWHVLTDKEAEVVAHVLDSVNFNICTALKENKIEDTDLR